MDGADQPPELVVGQFAAVSFGKLRDDEVHACVVGVKQEYFRHRQPVRAQVLAQLEFLPQQAAGVELGLVAARHPAVVRQLDGNRPEFR